MKHTILALALLLATPLMGLAATSGKPAPLALCASVSTTGALPMSLKQDPLVSVAPKACYTTIAYTCSNSIGRVCSVSDCPQFNTCGSTYSHCDSTRYVQCC